MSSQSIAPWGNKLPGQALSDAAFNGDVPLLEQIVTAGVPITIRDNDGFTALHRACVTGNSEVIKWLLDNGASVNEADAYGDLPLHYAAFCGHVYASYLLLQAGADPHKCSGDGKSPTLSAFEEKHWGVLHLIRILSPATRDLVPPFPSPEDQETAEAQLIEEGLQDLLTAYSTHATSPGSKPTLFRRFLGKRDGPTSPGVDGEGRFTPGGLSATQEGSRMIPRIFPPPIRESLPPPEAVAGMDFSRGVILEGALQKKRVNRVLKWRTRYFVLSSSYRALFFWSGSRSRVESVIKKIRFETFYAIQHYPDKKLGRRFDIKVSSGRVMQVQASTPEEAALWCHTLRTAVAPYMSVLKIQAAWRGHRVRRRLRRDEEDRHRVLSLITASGTEGEHTGVHGTGVASTSVGSSDTADSHIAKTLPPAVRGSPGKRATGIRPLPEGPLPPAGVLMEGELRKRNHHLASSLFSAYRTRYCVLHQGIGALVYYENKAKREQGLEPRVLPILYFHSTRQPRNKSGDLIAQFTLSLTNGTLYVFETRTPEEATMWVRAIQRILPRDHVAAMRIQKWYRSCRAKRNVHFLREHVLTWSADAAKKYDLDTDDVNRAGYVLVHFFKRLVSDRRMHRRELQNQENPEKLEKHDEKDTQPGHKTVTVKKRRSLWAEMKEPGTGRVYYYNIDNETSSWDRPSGLDDGTARLVTSYYSRYDPERKRKYYVNIQDNSTSWVQPSGYVSTDDEYEVEVEEEKVETTAADTTTVPTPGTVEPATSATTTTATTGTGTGRPSITIAPTSRPLSVAILPSPTPGTAPTRGVVQDVFSSATDEDFLEVSQELYPVPPLAARVAQQLLTLAQALPDTTPTHGITSGTSAADKQPMDLCALLRPYIQLGWLPIHDLGSGRVVYVRPSTKRMALRVPYLSRGGAPGTGFRADRSGFDSESDSDDETPDMTGDPEDILTYIDESTNKQHLDNELFTFSHWIRSALSSSSTTSSTSDILHLFQNHAQLANALYTLASTLSTPDTAPDTTTPALHVHTIPPGALDPPLPTGATFRRRLAGAGEGRSGPVVVRPGRDNLRMLLSYLAASGGLLPPRLSLSSLESHDSNAILDLLWAVIRHTVLHSLHPANTLKPGTEALDASATNTLMLLASGETAGDYLRLSPEVLLLRWTNLHLLLRGLREGAVLPLAGHVDSFGHLWADGRLLCALVGAVCPSEYTEDLPRNEEEIIELGPDIAVQRALHAAEKSGVPGWFRPEHFTALHIRVQILFLALLFRTHPRWDLIAARDTAPVAEQTEKYFTLPGVLGPIAAYHTRPGLPILLGLPDTVYPRYAFASATERTEAVRVFQDRSERYGLALESLYNKQTPSSDTPESIPSDAERDFHLFRSWIHARFGPDIVIQSVHPVAFVEEMDDGLLPLQIIDDLAPETIPWDEVHVAGVHTGALAPKQRRDNWIRVREAVASLKIEPSPFILNASDEELGELSINLCLDTLYSLMRYHCLYSLSAHVFKDQVTNEKPLLLWFQERVQATARVLLQKEMTEKDIVSACQFASLGDSNFEGGIAFAFLLQGLRPGYLDWEQIPTNTAAFRSMSTEEKLTLGDYLRTVAGRTGCYVLPHSWDLVHPRPLHMLVTLSSILLSTVP